MNKYFIITYGCQMNKSDSERIATVLEKIGYKKAPKIEGADLIIVNMCSVRQSAVDRVYGLQPKFQKLRTKLRTTHYPLQTVLTGCILKKDRKKFAQYFNYILNIKDLPHWKKILLKRLTIVSDLSKSENILKFDRNILPFQLLTFLFLQGVIIFVLIALSPIPGVRKFIDQPKKS